MQSHSSILFKAFDKSNDGLLILNKDKIVLANRKVRKILNIESSDYLGKSIYCYSTNIQVVEGKKIDIDKYLFDDIVNLKKNKIEWDFKTRFGSQLYVQIQISQIIESDQDFIFISIKDITPRKKFDLMLNARLTLISEAPHLNIEQLFRKTLDEIILLTESKAGCYYVVEKSKKRLKLVASVSNTAENEFDRYVSFSEEVQKAFGILLETKQIIINDNSRKLHATSLLKSASPERILILPIVREGKIVAISMLLNKNHCYSNQDSEMSQTIIDIIWDIAEKKKSDIALLSSELRFKKIFDNSNFGMVICDLDGLIAVANKAFCDFMKFNASENIGLNFFDLFHPDHKLSELEYQQLISGELSHFKSEKVFVDKWQDIKWGVVDLNIERNADDKPISIIGIIEDITEKKQNIFKLEQSEERFKLLSNIANEGICIHDRGIIIDANEALARMFKIENVDELIGLNIIDSKLMPDATKNELVNELYTSEDSFYDLIAHRNNGEQFNMELVGRNFFHDGRNYRIGLFRDVTHKKEAELALKRSERNFREFFNNTIISLFVFNNEGEIIEANEHACTQMEYSLKELRQMNITDLHPLSESEKTKEYFQQILSGKRNTCIVPFINKSNKIIPTTTYVSKGIWNGQDALFCVGKDMSELKKSEEKFNRAFHKNGNAMFIATKNELRFIEVNDRALEITGFGFDEIINKTDIELKLFYNEACRTQMLTEAAKGELKDYIYKFYNKKNELITVNLNVSTINFIEEEYYLISFSDVTEKIRTENALKESEIRLKEITENVQEGIILANMKFKYVFVNDTFAKMTGYSKAELMNMAINQLVVYGDDFKMAIKLVNQGGSISKKYVAMKRKDGSVFYINVSAKRIEIGNESYILGTQQDVTQEYEAEQKLFKAYEEITSLKNQLEQENFMLRQEINRTHSFSEIITQNREFKKILNQIEIVAPTDATVLIGGETGTGKELVARAIHLKSKRSVFPMVKLNCAAIPESLIESELFGHEKGSFTGAINQKIGRFEIANGGTLFLDEIGEMPFDLQSKLLRVLQEGEFERIGGSKTIKVDVRIITATNRDLNEEIEKGNFRLDLFYRLNVFPVVLPPLRERIDDISLLTNYFIEKFNKKMDKNISQIPVKVMDELIKYRWPGNVRELENLIERAMILSNGNTLKLSMWTPARDTHANKLVTFEEMQKNYIQQVLEHTNWKISGHNGATNILNLKYSTLVSKIQKLGIKKI